MKKSKNKILAIMLVIIFILNFALPVLVETSTVLATDITDYDFTDELDTDRVGIGFKWTAATKTLTITYIKNTGAKIILPGNSTIDIQGNIENEAGYIKCSGKLNIKGNDEASLKLTGGYQYTSIGNNNINGPKYEYAAIYASSLIVDSGNIKMQLKGSENNVYFYNGIKANVTINGGNLDIDKASIAITGYTIIINGGNINANSYKDTVSATNLTINDGNINIASIKGWGINTETTTIYGGNITTSGEKRGFLKLPNIDPNSTWTIQYNKDNASLEGAIPANIIDIYRIWDSKIIKISLNEKSNQDKVNNIDITDYDFTDELETDRVGIGFTWAAATKTLTITGIKNTGAKIILPGNSTIDIQGNIENEAGYIKCSGKLNIKGNDEASLKLTGGYQYTSIGNNNINGPKYEYAAIYASSLIVDSGNIKMQLKGSENNVYFYNGIKANVTINGGNLDIDKASIAITGYTIIINGGNINANSYKDTVSATNLTINDGNINIASIKGWGINTETTTIYGGNITTSGEKRGFLKLPNIDPNYNWKITYNTDATDLNNASVTNLYEIYNVWNSKAINIVRDNSITKIELKSEKDTICVGDSINIIAVIEPTDFKDTLIWSSSDESVATVSENGLVTGISNGKVTIKLSSENKDASKEIDVVYRITFDIGELENEVMYTDINGKIKELPQIDMDDKIINRWIDKEGNEITSETIFTDNCTIYAELVDKTVLVEKQQSAVKYGNRAVVEYAVESNFGGKYSAQIENLPIGISLESNDINFVLENGKYIGRLRLNVSDSTNACSINSLRLCIDGKTMSNNFKLEIDKAESNFIQEPMPKVVVFNGEEQEIIKAGSTNDGQILYSLDGVNFSEKLPTATNVGKYKVYYRIVGDKNHLDSEIKSIESTITDLIGDVNGDGKINARDAKLVLQYFNGKTEFTEEQKAKADVNGDGKINARDAKLILQIFNGK